MVFVKISQAGLLRCGALPCPPPPPPRDPGPQHTLLLIFFFKAEHANLAGTKLDPLHQTLIHGAGGVVNLGYRGWG